MAQTIKKTMEAPLAFLTELKGKTITEDVLNKFTSDYCVAKSATTSNGPREATILKDAEGNMLGRKCTVTELWFPASAFSKNTTSVKPADAAKGKLYNESKAMEKEAQKLLDEAKDITDIKQKVAKYEEFDAKLAEAKAHRLQDVKITPEMTKGGFKTIEDLAKNLNVPVITQNPVKEETKTEDEAK